VEAISFLTNGPRPAASSWGEELLATESRLDQIMLDAKWKPPLDLSRCAGAPAWAQPEAVASCALVERKKSALGVF